MAVTYGFFNSVLVNGMQDRRYNADQMSTYFKGLISDGVYQNVGGGLQVRAGEGMTVQVMAGRGVFDSRWMENDSILDIPLEPSHVTLNRYTAVVVRVDYNERTVSILAKDGETASAPVKPAITRTESVKEYCLAYVYVGRGVTDISQSAVTDTRPDNALCGFVTGLVEQIQTTDLFAQYDAAFDEWFETIEGKLSGDVAGKLTVDVERLEREKQDTISGTKGQIVGFDDDGTPVAQEPSDTGVTSFKGRKGAVMPRAGDYSAVDVGALPISGGTLTGNLTIKGTGNYGMKINLGDGDYVHISEPADDCMEIKAKKVNFVISSTGEDMVTINSKPLTGKSLAGQKVQLEDGTMFPAGSGAEIFNDYRNRTLNDIGDVNQGNIAFGEYSHAEGMATTANGDYSHAEGKNTKALGLCSHAEGYYTVARDIYSHAEGERTRATYAGSHAEGTETMSIGAETHAEGIGCIAGAWYGGHAEGNGCLSLYKNFYDKISSYSSESNYFVLQNSHLLEKLAADKSIIVTNDHYISTKTHVFTIGGVSTSNKRVYVKEAIPDYNFVPVYLIPYTINETDGNSSHAEGERAIANNIAAHAEGRNTTSSGTAAHAEGFGTIASGNYSHSEGQHTQALEFGAHAEGSSSRAVGANSHAEGQSTQANALGSHAGGNNTTADASYQTVIGAFNVSYTSSSSRFIIGKGSDSARANCFRVTNTGVYASGSYNASGADYAEFFEWLDGNLENADRVGLFVTLEGEKIRLAQPGDDFILGIVSAEPSVCGDVYDDQWKGMYLYDIYGRPLWEDVEVPDETTEEPDPENPGRTITRVVIPAHTEHRQKLNPDYDNTQPYVPRSERSEWAAVGMLGKLVMRDDGTCRADGWCTVGESGTATYSDTRTKYRVMARLDESHIRVLIL